VKKTDNKWQEMYKDLGITDEQKKLLEANQTKHREQTKALYAQMRQKGTLLQQELEKKELNMQVITQTNNEIKQIQAQMLDDRLESILEVRKILTPEQFKKFEDKINERMEHFKNQSRGKGKINK
jgi:Spy/CpxP family protein refolding chaperone